MRSTVASTVDRITQRIIQLDHSAKPAFLAELLKQEPVNRALVFTRTKHGADKVVKSLARAGIAADAIHGNKSQNHRERVLAAFRSGAIRTLVATDIAARGIDVDGVSHVVNFDLPNVPETYVHRIGRTARAGAEGIAISLCDSEEVAFLRDIEKLIRMTIPATGERLDRPHVEQPRTAGAATRPSASARQRPGKRKGPARRQDRRGEPSRSQAPSHHSNQDRPDEAPSGIESIAFIQGKARPERNRAPRAQRWAGHSQGT